MYGTLQEAGERLATSTQFLRTGVDILLVQGIHTLYDDVLNREALTKIWLYQSDLDSGLKRMLISRGLWRPDDVGYFADLVKIEDARHTAATLMENSGALTFELEHNIFYEWCPHGRGGVR